MALVVFRADGGSAIGAGHVMRCLALARVFAAGGWRIGFAATQETFASVQSLANAKLEQLSLDVVGRHREVKEAAALSRRWPEGADALIVDHYERDVAFERECRGWAKRIIAVDDLADRPHDVDILVDVATPGGAYRGLVPESCEVLTGPAYAIIDGAFRAARECALARRHKAEVECVLVSFGQIDAPNATRSALAALAAADFSGEVDVVLGHAAPHLAAIRGMAGPRVRLHIDADNMPALMTEADLAIGAGGVTALERCCLGLPSLLVTIADNQREIVAMLQSKGTALDIGKLDSDTEGRIAERLSALFVAGSRRAEMADAGARLVDGLGAERIMLAIVGAATMKDGCPVRLRPATIADEAWLLQLQSQPETRRWSNDRSIPTLEAHRKWLVRTLANPSRLLMIADMESVAVGMLRLDRQDIGERVSIAVDSRYHRRGIGAAMLALAASLRPGCVLDAEVLPSNTASQTLFAAAGYRQVREHLFRRGPT